VNFQIFDSNSNSLYVSDSNSPGWAVKLYYLMLGPGDRPPKISFDSAWVNRSGAYFFLPSDQPITSPAAFVDALLKLLPNPTPQSQWLAWIPSAKPQDVTAANVRLLPISKKQGLSGDGRVLSLSALKFGNLELVIQSETYVSADTSDVSPLIRLHVNPVTGRTLTLRQTNTSRALDLPVDALRVDCLPDVLRGPYPHEAREAELDVDLGDHAHGCAGEGNVRRPIRDLAGLGVERIRARMAVDAFDVDVAARPLTFLERRATRELDGAGRHPGHPRGGGGACRPDPRGRRRRQRDVLDRELRSRDLEADVGHSLPDLGPGAEDLGAFVRELHARRARVVEALGVADVLETGGEADTAADALAVGRIAGATR